MSDRLPVTRDLTLAYVGSIVVAVIMTIASVAGLVAGLRLYGGTDLRLFPLFVGQDALNLVVGLPLLFGTMWLARRGSLIGLLLWPGALFYVIYDYGYYVLGAPFSWLFVPYLALITVSTYAMIGIVVSVDSTAVRDRMTDIVPARLIGGVLVALAVLFTTLWTAMTMSTLVAGAPLDVVPRIVTIMDLTVQLPALLVAGVLLWRRQAFGYVVAAGLLLQAAAYLVGLAAITALQEVLTASPIDPVAIGPGVVVGAICLALIAPFVRGASTSRAPRTNSALKTVEVTS